MNIYKVSASIIISLAFGASVASECEVSLPETGNLPESVRKAPAGFKWVGTEKLAAQVPEDGHWTGMGASHNYRDKFWWWRKGYRAQEETKPKLSITAKRLDGAAPPVHIPHATNAFGEGWHRILVGMEFPTDGCWLVVGNYHDNELRFVFKVGD